MTAAVPPAPADHDIAVNGISLRYAAWGTYTTPERTVLLIHGITASSRYWALAGPTLAAQGWYAIAPDLRGRGLSDKPPHGYGIPFHVNDLLALCDVLDLPTVNVVGHSLGAHIALFMAALYGPRVHRLVLADGGGRVPDDALEAVASSVKRLGIEWPSVEAYVDALRQAAPFPWTPFWDAYYRYDAGVRPDGTVTSRMPLAAYREEVAVLDATRTETLAALVRAPTVIVRATVGTKTPTTGFVLPAAEAERMRATIPDCQLVELPDTNHYTVILVDAFAREVLAFLGAA
jgi:pimeloyl-ACP methyl ester carboxylesterase